MLIFRRLDLSQNKAIKRFYKFSKTKIFSEKYFRRRAQNLANFFPAEIFRSYLAEAEGISTLSALSTLSTHTSLGKFMRLYIFQIENSLKIVYDVMVYPYMVMN